MSATTPTPAPIAPEMAAVALVRAGVLSVDAEGRVWRHRRKVGGNQGPRLIDVPVTRADRRLPNGRRQVQIYVDGRRLVCLAYRLVWALHHGPIPASAHIHHRDGDPTNNRISNLALIDGKAHIASHGRGRAPHNKGQRYGLTQGYQRSHAARVRNYQMKCKTLAEDFNNGYSAAQLAEREGLSTRQIYSRLRSDQRDGHAG